MLLADEGASESFCGSEVELCDRSAAGKDQGRLKRPHGSRHCQEHRQAEGGPNAKVLWRCWLMFTRMKLQRH